MFEKAIRLKLRFDSPKGLLTVEDLWDLPLTSGSGKANLNDLAKTANREVQASEEEDFVRPTKANTLSALKLEVLKHVIQTRMAESEAAQLLIQKKQEKEYLLELIAKKKNAKLESLTEEELVQRVQAL